MLNWPIASVGGAACADTRVACRASAHIRIGPALASLAATVITALVSISVPAASAELGDPQRGRAYAERICAQCHAVGPSDTTSPRPEATPFSVMARTAGINERALSVFLQTPHAAMPNLIVTGQDRDNLIAYILSLRNTR